MNSSPNSSSGSVRAVQPGETPPDAKPLKGFGGASVIELIEDHRGSTPRASIRYDSRPGSMCFKRRRSGGIANPKRELDLIRERLKWAERLYTGDAEGV